MLSIGEMLSGVSEDSLTWVPICAYLLILVTCSPRFAERGMWCSLLVRCDALIIITGVSIYLGGSPRRRIPRRRKAALINTLIAFRLSLCPRRQCKSPFFTSHSTHPSSSLLLTGRVNSPQSRRRRTQHPIQTRPQWALSLLRTTHHCLFYWGQTLPCRPDGDFIQQVSENNVVTCTSRLGFMNPPVLTGY